MNREQEAAKIIVQNYWEEKFRRTHNKEALAKIYQVRQAKPEELVNDFEAILAILEKALKQLRGEE